MVIIQNETAPLFQCQLLHVRNRKREVRALFLLSFASLSASQSFTVRFIISLAHTERKKEPNFRFWLAPLKSTAAITGTPLALILMGRVKLKIKRLESTNNRQVTYSKRRNGILKKARELSVLCDIDIILLMFSPNGKPTFFHGERSNIEEVIARFSQLTPQERAKRKLESLEALKKTFLKLDHDVNIQDFLGASNQTVEELTDQIRVMQDQLAEVHKRLSYWSNLDNIDSIDHLRQMEDSLRESINRIHLHKENIGKCQLMSLDYTTPFQNGSLPLMMSGLQEVQPLLWLPNNGNEHMFLSGEPSFMSHRDMECSTDVSLPGSSGYFSTGKQTEIGTSGSVDNMGQEGATLSELSSTGCLNLQVGDQFSCPYGNLSYTDDKKLKAPEMEMNLQGNHAVYQVNSNFEMPRPVYDNGHHNWVPNQGPCSVAMYNGNSYNPQSN